MPNKPANLCRRRGCHGTAVVRSNVDGKRICKRCKGKEYDWAAVAAKRKATRDYKAEYQRRKANNGKD